MTEACCDNVDLQKSGSSHNGLIRLWQCRSCTATFRDKKPLVALEDLDDGWTSEEDIKTNAEIFKGMGGHYGD